MLRVVGRFALVFSMILICLFIITVGKGLCEWGPPPDQVDYKKCSGSLVYLCALPCGVLSALGALLLWWEKRG